MRDWMSSLYQIYNRKTCLTFQLGSLESPQNIGSLDYLIKWSELDHSAYCLSLLFTYRDFSGGVLGKAWVAQPEPRVLGGICSPRVFLQERGQLMSFNTALATFLNFGRRVPRKVSTITVMHEFGHNFGSGVSVPHVAKWFTLGHLRFPPLNVFCVFKRIKIIGWVWVRYCDFVTEETVTKSQYFVITEFNNCSIPFVTGLCHKEITWDMRVHLCVQLPANLQSVWSYVDHFHLFRRINPLDMTRYTGAVKY